MMTKLLSIALASALLTGCATGDEYRQYAEAQKSVANARAMAEAARYQALAEIAKSGDTAAKVAAVMTLQQNGSGGQSQQHQQLMMPESFSDKALRWAQVIVPTATQTLTAVYTVKKQTDLATVQSNNQAAVAASTNNTFAAMNGNMATSNTNIANAGFTAVSTTAANGITGIVTTATNGLTTATSMNANSNTAITAVSTAANASIQAISSQLSRIQPNITTTTTSTSTSTTTNSCGANHAGGTLTCP